MTGYELVKSICWVIFSASPAIAIFAIRWWEGSDISRRFEDEKHRLRNDRWLKSYQEQERIKAEIFEKQMSDLAEKHNLKNY